jgi:hypothetical protein
MRRSLYWVPLLAPLCAEAIVIGQATVASSLDKRIISKVVFLSVPAIRQCYQAQLLKEPSLRGELTIHFTIMPSGSVGLAMLDGDGLSPAVDTCVTRLFALMKFPAVNGAGKIEVYFPFSFEPPKEQP